MDDILKNTFDGEATHYDETTQYLLLDYDLALEKTIHLFDFSSNDSFYILDLGCGTGNLTQKIRAYYPNAIVYALDFSEDMISVAKNKRISNVNYILADMFDMAQMDLPYFDVVVSSFVFHNFRTIEEHEKIYSLISERLSVNGKFIIADLVDLEDPFRKKNIQERLVNLMRNNNIGDAEIVKWLGILEIEDSPLTVSKEIELLYDKGFEMINVNPFDSNVAVYSASKKLNLLQLKAELLLYGVKSNDLVRTLYLNQNPRNVWKTGNNGIFVSIGGLTTLISINHESNYNSPYELAGEYNNIKLTKNGIKLDVLVMPLQFPKWFFEEIPELDNKLFSEYFVFEGNGFLHLAYKGCGFSDKEKCRYCATQRRDLVSDSKAEEICVALSRVIDKFTDDIQICLGGGTYIPFEENVEYFSTIIKFIRKHNKTIPIWVEMIPPKIEDIERLIEDGATSFGFNIEIWNDDLRNKICPGKSIINKDYYIEACRYVIGRLGINRVGSCLIVGLDAFESIKEAIDNLVAEGIEPCILPYKVYNQTDLGEYNVPASYRYDFYWLSKYASQVARKGGINFDENQGCLKCNCCTIMHDFQKLS